MQPKQIIRALLSPSYLVDLFRFRAAARLKGTLMPAWRKLRPITDEATATTGFDTHYIYHTGWAARVLARTRPERHVDIGSSLYFVSIASAYQPMIHYDYRPPVLALPGADVGAADLLNLSFADNSIPSLSCMHVVEHVGLGRYGDTLDPEGDKRACAELARVLAPGGRLLFVTPVGQPAIHFNAHRIYSFEGITGMFAGLELEEFALITDKRDGATLVLNADPARVARQRYGCGCFVFRKPG
jgi:SAM-dependent methyltransferase